MNNIIRIRYRKDIQILRAIAVISVVLFHIDKSVFKYGYIGVDIFFVISGFVISNIIYSKLSKNEFKLKEFVFMRFKRIIPALISYLLFVQIVLFFNVDHQNVIQNTKTSLYSILLLANIHISQYIEYFTVDSSKNLVVNLWSLSVEEQFYILFPLIAILLKKVKISTQSIIYLLIISISLFSINEIFFLNIGLLQKIFLNYENFIFYSPITRVWEFILGVLAMFTNSKLTNTKNLNKFIGLSLYLLLISSLLLNLSTSNNFINVVIANLTTFLLLSFEMSDQYKNKTYLKFLIFTGNISYSLYLFHQGVLAGIRNHNYYSTYLGNYIDLNNWIILTFVIIVIYLISTLNYYLVENRYRKISTPSLKEFKSLILLFIITLSSILVSLNTNGYSFRHTDLVSFNNKVPSIQYLNGTNYLLQDGNQCLNRSKTEDLCKFETSETNKKIYVVGDSMISSLVSGFLNNKINNDYTIIESTKGGCALLINTCDFFMGSERFNTLVDVENSIFILGGRYQNHLNEDTSVLEFEQKLIETIKLLNSKGNLVYLILPIPEPGINERMYYFKTSEYLDYDYDKWKNSIDELSKLLNKINLENFHLIDIDYLFCNEQKCNFKNDEHYYFIDHVHFSYFGANYVAAEIIDIIENKVNNIGHSS